MGAPPMFERRHQPLLPVPLFMARMGKSLVIAVAIDVVFLFAGALGFRQFEGLDWPDALLNAGLVVTGNGPITRMQTAPGKVFLLVYAIVGVVVFVAVIYVELEPVMHRTVHDFYVVVRA